MYINNIIKFLITIILIYFYYLFKHLIHEKRSINIPKEINGNPEINKIIKENFFIIDSNSLEGVLSYLYGYSVSKNGIITNNYYKRIGHYEEPESQGAYVLIKRNGNEIQIYQDYYGSYGVYIYENKNYFAFSNSFLLLVKYLSGNENMTFNEDFADNLIISAYSSPSIYESLVKEINKIPSNSFITINIKEKKYKINYIDQQRYTIPFESEEGLKIIDNWVDKWGYIFRSLKKKTDNIIMDLSGGFDTRAVLSVLYNSGIDLNSILIHSINKKVHTLEEDFKIATNISSKLGFKLNNKILNSEGTIFDLKTSLDISMYTRLGFHKDLYFVRKFLKKPKFLFSGGWGEILRGFPNMPIQEYIEAKCSRERNICNYEKFYNSSKMLLTRSINRLKKERKYNDDYELSIDLFLKGEGANHFGKSCVQSFITNLYKLEPLADPDIKKLKISKNNERSYNDLIAYIYTRFCGELINFPFDSKRILNNESIKFAQRLNNKNLPYKIKSDYNNNFFIDNKRESPVYPSEYGGNSNNYLQNIYLSRHFISTINKIYNNNVYNWAKNHMEKSNYRPLRNFNSLFAISIIFRYLSNK